jgi:hypothetical protein
MSWDVADNWRAELPDSAHRRKADRVAPHEAVPPGAGAGGYSGMPVQ